ncbi:MAG: TonB-dependent receptor [Methylococcales bacterium]
MKNFRVKSSKVKLSASLISLAFTSPVFATETINFDDVVVTASRVPQAREAAIADVSVIDAEEIQRTGQSSLVELLSHQPGIEITSSGGAGTVSSIYMRGTNSGHVVVLVDGIRVDSATLGSTSFENLPLGQIDKIEILRGPASSLYGQDAIGGVIQIFTKKGEGVVKFNANLGYGTYNTKKAGAGVSGSINDTRFAVNVSSLNTRSFSAIDTTSTDYNDNDGNRNLSFSGNITHQIETDHEIGLQFLRSDSRAHFDNAGNFSNFDSRTEAKQYSYAVFSSNQFTDFWLSKVRIGEGVDESRTFDQYSVSGGDFYKTNQFQLNWQNDFKLPVGVLTLLYDGLYQKVNSSAVSYTVKTRDNDGFVASYLLDYSAHSLQISARHDSNSQFGSHNTGSLGYGYKINPNWRATASYGTAFKAPTFNDLYWPFQDYGIYGTYSGNPTLKPEQSRNIEASLRYQHDNTTVSATAYHNSIDNLIALNGLFAAQPVNINQATIKGLTLSASQHLGNLDLSGNLDLQSPKDDKTDKLLVRRANRHASANVSYQFGSWRFGAETIASSIRFNDAANQKDLSGYALVNATVDYKFSKDWSVQARANNILDKKYALALDFGGEAYNTPRANLFFSVRYQPE